MKNMTNYLWFCVLILLGFAEISISALTDPNQTEKRIGAVMLAITDEIYFYGMEDEAPILNTGKSIPVYIEMDESRRSCMVIYKLYPHGEIFRRFYFVKDGLAILSGDARKGFLWWQHRNAFVGQTTEISDEDLIRYKQTWLKRGYILKSGFDKTDLIMRQALRIEFLRKSKETASKVQAVGSCPP